MLNNEEYTSYCGLYCADCIPSNSSLFAAAETLRDRLKDRKFEEYAKLKSSSNKAFKHYAEFSALLQEIIDLQCSSPCRLGGGKAVCPVRDCAQKKDLRGCWECDNRSDCELLAPLRQFHPNLDYHLTLISQLGENNWSAERKGHYFWE
jgi:hypothetical protein